MSARNNGGQAFPTSDLQTAHAIAAAATIGVEGADERDHVYTAARAQAQQGMTLRDYFTAKAMQAAISAHITHYGHDNYWPPKDIASYANEVADAMLAAREAE